MVCMCGAPEELLMGESLVREVSGPSVGQTLDVAVVMVRLADDC